jgi:hypothetical protein
MALGVLVDGCLEGKIEYYGEDKNNKSSIYKYLIIRCFV